MNANTPDDPDRESGEQPPEYPQEGSGYEEQPGGEYNEDEQERLGPSAPAVAAAPGRAMLFMGLAVLLLVGAVYLLWGGGEEEGQVTKEKEEAETAQGETSVAIAPEAPPPIQLPPPPTPQADAQGQQGSIPVPPPPPIDGAFPPPPIAEFEATGVNDEALQARRKSEMLILNARSGGGAKSDAAQAPAQAPESPDPNAQFASNVFRSSGAETAEAGQVGDLHSTIAQGKIVHAVLETAVNTDLPGTLRAVVSRDIYAEAGRAPLIPKGSRLIGTYNTDVLFGQGRIFIIWTRVIRPDGVDVAINSPGVDRLGRGGVGGKVDNKYFEIYSAAVLTSVLNIGVAYGVEELTNPQVTQTTDPQGNTTTQTSPTNEAALEAIGRMGQVTSRVVDRVINVRPTIMIDQGTPVNVFVNRDLIFPPGSSGGTRTQIVP